MFFLIDREYTVLSGSGVAFAPSSPYSGIKLPERDNIYTEVIYVKVTRNGAPTAVQTVSEQPAPKARWEPPSWLLIAVCVAVPLCVGLLIGALTGASAKELYASLKLPPLSPPDWIFSIVWTVLYALMGIASYLVIRSGCTQVRMRCALTAYAVQLLLNAVWMPVFFLAMAFGIAAIISLALMAALAITMDLFTRCSTAAGKLLIPCLLWVTFATYLTIGVALLN